MRSARPCYASRGRSESCSSSSVWHSSWERCGSPAGTKPSSRQRPSKRCQDPCGLCIAFGLDRRHEDTDPLYLDGASVRGRGSAREPTMGDLSRGEAAAAKGTFPPLRHAVFRRIWTASLMSNLGLLIMGV